MADNFICVRHENRKSALACKNHGEHNSNKQKREQLKNVDASKTKNNTHICFNGYDDKKSPYANFRAKARAYKQAKGKRLRTDAVAVIETVYTISPDVVKTIEDEKAFLRGVIATHKELVGSCPFMLDLHLDEKTIHAHVLTIPYDSELVSYNQKINNKHAYSRIQDDFAKHCCEQGLEVVRGKDKELTGAKHENPKQWNKEEAEIKAEYEQKKADFQAEQQAIYEQSCTDIVASRKKYEKEYHEQNQKIYDEYKKADDKRLEEQLQKAGLSKTYGIMDGWKRDER